MGNEKGCRAPITVYPLLITALDLFFRRDLACILFQHHRYAVLYRVAEPAGVADEFAGRLAIEQRPLADRADEYVEQFVIHGGRPLRAGRRSSRPAGHRGW